MELKKLITQTLHEALASMEIGEMRIAPDTTTPGSVKRACTEMKAKGYLFTTTTKPGKMIITRMK